MFSLYSFFLACLVLLNIHILKVMLLKNSDDKGFPGASVSKNSPASGIDSWSRKMENTVEKPVPCTTTIKPAL